MLDRTLDILRRGIHEGLHAGAQIYISQNGEVLIDDAVGESLPGVRMTRDSITHWFSSVKPVTAIAIAMLWERQKLSLDDTVAKHIPEFAAGGKEAITIRHLLTHTGGFRGTWRNLTPEPWDELIAKICATRIEPGWIPGEKAGYHPASSWLILGEIVRRIDGRMIDLFVREEIYLPLKMNDSWIGIPPKQFAAYGDRIAPTWEGASRAPVTPEEAALVRPGGNGRGPIRELGRFYEMLLNGGTLDGATLLSPHTVRDFTTRQRIGMFDHTFKHILDFGFGFIVNSAQYGVETVPYGYGRFASPETFGHSGAQSSCAFCDPQRRLVVAWLCNVMPGEAEHQQRQRAINDAIYQDLG